MGSKILITVLTFIVSSPSFAQSTTTCRTAGALQEFRLEGDNFSGVIVKSRGADCELVSVKNYIYECRALNWTYTDQVGREVFVVNEHGEEAFASYSQQEAEKTMAQLSCSGELEE